MVSSLLPLSKVLNLKSELTFSKNRPSPLPVFEAVIVSVLTPLKLLPSPIRLPLIVEPLITNAVVVLDIFKEPVICESLFE